MANNYCECMKVFDNNGTWSDCPKHEYQCYVLTCDVCNTPYPDCED